MENEIEKVKCSNCGYEINPDDAIECSECGEQLCDACISTCRSCGRKLCADCLHECDSCGRVMCSDCSHELDCGHEVCGNCDRYCDDHNYSYCRDCTCERCAEDDCPDLKSASENPRVFYCGANPEWECIRTASDRRDAMCFGVELECNFSGKNEPRVLRVPVSYLPEKHIWKEDGSIGDGAELVTAPHSLAAWRKVDTRGMLQKLKAYGATSYDSGRCGLHIHTCRSAYDDLLIEKLKLFFSRNRDYVIAFSRRTDEQLRWCGFPDMRGFSMWSHQKYSALHDTGNTIEWRIFRGTLYWPRFKASLQFVDSLISYCRLISKQHAASRESLRGFYDHIDRLGYKELKACNSRWTIEEGN